MVNLKMRLTPEQWIFLRRFVKRGVNVYNGTHDWTKVHGYMRDFYRRRGEEIDELGRMFEDYDATANMDNDDTVVS